MLYLNKATFVCLRLYTVLEIVMEYKLDRSQSSVFNCKVSVVLQVSFVNL